MSSQKTPRPTSAADDRGEQFIFDTVLPLEDRLSEIAESYGIPAGDVVAAWGVTATAGGSVPERLNLIRECCEKARIYGEPLLTTLRTIMDLADESRRAADNWHIGNINHSRNREDFRNNFK